MARRLTLGRPVTSAAFDALRDRRRKMAHQLRSEGLPLREIAARLGVSHPTVIEDLKGPAMTAAAAVSAARPRFSEQNVKLTMLLTALDGLGLTDQLPEARKLLARAVQVEADASAAGGRARKEFDALPGLLADGQLTMVAAALRAAELSVWLRPATDAESAHGMSERLAMELRLRAVASARDQGMAVHGRLSKLAEAAVARGAEAGGQLLDVKAFIAALRAALAAVAPRAGQIRTGPVFGGDPYRGVRLPKLPAVTVEDIAADPVKMGHWAVATAACEQMGRLFETAAMLHLIAGGRSMLYAGQVDSDERSLVGDLAVPLQYAVTSGLGWRPGLWLDPKPGKSRPFDAGKQNPPVTPLYPTLGTRP